MGPIWAYMGPHGPIWAHIGSYGPIRAHMGPYGPIWGPYGPIYPKIPKNPRKFLGIPRDLCGDLCGDLYLYKKRTWTRTISKKLHDDLREIFPI